AYTASLGYDLSPKKAFGFKPLGFLPSFWLLKKLERTQFSPLPATLNFSGDVSRSLSTTILNDGFNRPTVSYIRDFRGRGTAGFRIFPNLSADYTFSTRRDISNPENLAFSFSPKKFKLGLEVERRQDFRTAYNPGLLPFADTRFTFSSSYSEALVVGLGALGGTRRIDGSSGYGANVNFSLTRFLGKPKGPSAAAVARQRVEQEKKEAERKAKEEEKKRLEEEKKKAERWPLDSARIADSLARAAVEARARERAALDSIPVEVRFRESMNRFVPLPVPAFGFVLPRLGPAKQETAAPVPAFPVAVPPNLVSRPGGDSLGRWTADSARPGLGFTPGDSAKKATPPPALAKEKGEGGVFFLSGGLNFVRKLADRI
ncbi:MAG TPA: hypothetical protein VFR89_06760, partial [candidate division Zixibacteria bacterium]|nr:hypothetical protein [candidate division Zixibacteria bacterium]